MLVLKWDLPIAMRHLTEPAFHYTAVIGLLCKLYRVFLMVGLRFKDSGFPSRIHIIAAMRCKLHLLSSEPSFLATLVFLLMILAMKTFSSAVFCQYRVGLKDV